MGKHTSPHCAPDARSSQGDAILDGKIALITGVDGPVGRAAALLFAAGGVRLALAGRRFEHAEAVACEIELAGGRAAPYEIDVSMERDAAAAIDRIAAEQGPIDILVNCGDHEAEPAGNDAETSDLGAGARMGRLCSLAARSAMNPRRRGVIINARNYSSGARDGDSADAVLAMAGLTRRLARSFAPLNVAVNGVVPRTPSPIEPVAQCSNRARRQSVCELVSYRLARGALLFATSAGMASGTTILV